METEILKGPNIRVTTETVQVRKTRTSVADIRDLALVEGDRRIGLLPQVIVVIGLVAGLGVVFLLGSIPGGTLVSLVALTIAALLYQDRLQHKVTASSPTGARLRLYRTPRLADARIFHAAIAKALELRQPQA